jgi:ATP-dependent DNA helicase RecG
MTFITKKVGITKAFDIRFTDEQVLLADLNSRQINAMRYLRDNVKITTSIYQKINQTTAVTAKRDLSQLVRKGKVKRMGRGKSTYYVLA